MYQEGLWAAQRWVQNALKAVPSGSKIAPRRTKKALGRRKKVSWTLKNDSKPLPEWSKIWFSLDTSFKNRYFNNVLLKHTCVTSCKCLEVLWSALKPSWNYLGSLRKVFWSLQNDSKPISESAKIVFSLDTSFKNEVLKQYATKTNDGDVLSVFRGSWKRVESLLKPSWTLERGLLVLAERLQTRWFNDGRGPKDL